MSIYILSAICYNIYSERGETLKKGSEVKLTMPNLVERFEAVVRENEQLKAENEQLKADIEALKLIVELTEEQQ